MENQENESVIEEVVDKTTEQTLENEVEKPQEEVETKDQESISSVDEDGTIKIDLRKLNQDQPEKPEVESEQTEPEQVEAEQDDTAEDQVLEEVTEEEVQEQVEELQEEVEEVIAEAQETGEPLPENIQKVVDFMNETGGSLEDYVKLNTDYSSLNDKQLLREYYENTKPHLDKEDIDILMEDFSYDEELDDEKSVRKSKIAFKEEVAKAKNHLESLKSKYYEEIKAGSKLTPDQQKAVDFFNRYNKESEEENRVAKNKSDIFLQKTNKVFSDNFKGFEYSVGDKKYRFNVKNASEVKQTQSDINNFVKRFLAEDSTMGDAKGYHKALFTAMNADAIANHFYEQGKADAIKNSVAKSKNVDMDPRGVHEPVTEAGGLRVRAISGDDSSRLKVKIRK
jgi:hypothetical protein|tara:strand:+ start:1146 stop:2333 length:1188 start_codon:yes stop_codon:yes gene_type:complete